MDCLSRLKGNENIGGVRITIEGLASLAVAEGRMERAACLFAWADGLRQKSGGLRPPNEQADVERDFAILRAQLDQSTLQAATSDGQAMSLEEALAYATGEKG